MIQIDLLYTKQWNTGKYRLNRLNSIYLKKLYFTCENINSCISHENINSCILNVTI